MAPSCLSPRSEVGEVQSHFCGDHSWWNKVPCTVSINGNPELVDVTALAGVGTDDDYLILHADNVTQYKLRPPVDSRFHQNILQIR